MTDLNKTIEYTFKLTDNVTTAAQSMEMSAEGAADAVRNLESEETTLKDQTAETTMELDKQQLSIITQMTAIAGLRTGLAAITEGMTTLGLVSDESAEALRKVMAGFNLMIGAVTIIKSVQGAMTALNTSTAIYDALATYGAVLKNPATLALVGLGLGATAGFAGAYLMSNNTTSTVNNQTTINVQDTTPQEATSEVYQVISGGAL